MADQRPALSPELSPTLTAIKASVPGGLPSLSHANFQAIRQGFPGIPGTPGEHFSRCGRFRVDEATVPRDDGRPPLPLLICRPTHTQPLRGVIYYIHGGGFVLGSYVNGVDEMLDYASSCDLAVVSVNCRLAPEAKHPEPVEDCWAGLGWVREHTSELNVPAGRIVIAGESAGGGLAAATALLARDRQGPDLRGQLLIAPMLDHRSRSPSMQLLLDTGMWDRESNQFGWDALLGTDRELVSPYGSPSVADDLTRLPATFIDVGGADAFRDEDVDYAMRLSSAAGLVELHVWAGAFHSFDGIVPNAEVSQDARRARRRWLNRTLPPNTLDQTRTSTTAPSSTRHPD